MGQHKHKAAKSSGKATKVVYTFPDSLYGERKSSPTADVMKSFLTAKGVAFLPKEKRNDLALKVVQICGDQTVDFQYKQDK